MIAYIKGSIAYKSPTYVIVEAGGIGYHIHISLHTYAQIEKLERVQLWTYTHILQDSGQHLYGFSEVVERNLFEHLVSVSGVGANTARLILSAMSPDEVRHAIIGENEQAFIRVKGVGAKTAKRLIIDLKDRLLKDSGEETASLAVPDGKQTMREEAANALIALGFQRVAVLKTLNGILQEANEDATVEQVIKAALKKLF